MENNYYEMLGKLGNGKVMQSKENVYSAHSRITRLEGKFFYCDDDNRIKREYGDSGVVDNHAYPECFDWEIVEDFVEIDLLEVKERFAESFPVFIDSRYTDSKTQITQYADVPTGRPKADFDDVFFRTTFYKEVR